MNRFAFGVVIVFALGCGVSLIFPSAKQKRVMNAEAKIEAKSVVVAPDMVAELQTLQGITYQSGGLKETLYVFAPYGRNVLAVFDPGSNSFVHLQSRPTSTGIFTVATVKVLPVHDPGSPLQELVLLLNMKSDSRTFLSEARKYAGNPAAAKAELEQRWKSLPESERADRLEILKKNTEFRKRLGENGCVLVTPKTSYAFADSGYATSLWIWLDELK